MKQKASKLLVFDLTMVAAWDLSDKVVTHFELLEMFWNFTYTWVIHFLSAVHSCFWKNSLSAGLN